MVNFEFAHGMAEMQRANVDLEGGDIRALLICEGSTVATEPAAATFADFTTLNEYEAVTGYATGGFVLGGKVVSVVAGATPLEYHTKFDATDISVVALAPNTLYSGADAIGMLIALYNAGTPTASIPLKWIDDVGSQPFPFNGNNAAYSMQWAAEGILTLGKVAA